MEAIFNQYPLVFIHHLFLDRFHIYMANLTLTTYGIIKPLDDI